MTLTLAALKTWAMSHDSEGLAGYGRIHQEWLGRTVMTVNYSSITINYAIDAEMDESGRYAICESNSHRCTILTGEKSGKYLLHDEQVIRLLSNLEKYEYVTFGDLLREIALADCPVISEDIWGEAA